MKDSSDRFFGYIQVVHVVRHSTSIAARVFRDGKWSPLRSFGHVAECRLMSWLPTSIVLSLDWVSRYEDLRNQHMGIPQCISRYMYSSATSNRICFRSIDARVMQTDSHCLRRAIHRLVFEAHNRSTKTTFNRRNEQRNANQMLFLISSPLGLYNDTSQRLRCGRL